jgi:RimJ/RimL family protein N-acetyltransferase
VETEWSDWDAPWDVDDGCAFVDRQRKALGETPQAFRKLEIDDRTGRHVGWVSSYHIEGDQTKTAVGINLPSVYDRGKGFGENALSAFMAYLFRAESVLYTQTWSGNTAMLRLAEKIGFTEVERAKDLRVVKGRKYDALTFSVSKDDFFRNYPGLQ